MYNGESEDMLHTKNMSKKTTSVNVRLREGERQELDDIAEVLDVPTSQIVREAVREQVAKLKKRHPKLKNREEVVA